LGGWGIGPCRHLAGLEADVFEVGASELLLAEWAGSVCMPPLVDALFAVLN